MATFPRVPTVNATSYTLNSQISAGASTLTLNASVAGIVRAPGYIVIDRVDSAGNITATKREYKKFTGVSGANLTGLTGGLAGSTDQVHAVGAIVEIVPDVLYEQDWYDTIITEHNTDGTHTNITTNKITPTNISASGASVQLGNTFIQNLNASGASLAGILSTVPVWNYIGNLSAATGLAAPLVMPRSGTIDYVTAILRVPPTSASLQIDIFKNGISIFSVFPGILAGGTFISTASIATQIFNRGDVFTASNKTVASANGNDLSVMFHAR